MTLEKISGRDTGGAIPRHKIRKIESAYYCRTVEIRSSQPGDNQLGKILLRVCCIALFGIPVLQRGRELSAPTETGSISVRVEQAVSTQGVVRGGARHRHRSVPQGGNAGEETKRLSRLFASHPLRPVEADLSGTR